MSDLTAEALGIPQKITGEDPRRRFRKLMRSLADRSKQSYTISQNNGAYLFPNFYVLMAEDGGVTVQPLSGDNIHSFTSDLTLRGAATRQKKMRVDSGNGRAKFRPGLQIQPTLSLDEFKNTIEEVLMTEHNLESGEDIKADRYWYSFALVQLYSLNHGDVDEAINMMKVKLGKQSVSPTHFVFLPGNIIGLGPMVP